MKTRSTIWRNKGGERLFFSILLMIMTILGGCPMPVGQRLAVPRAGAEKVALDYDLQRYVPVPVTGAGPVLDLTRPDLTIRVQWKKADGTDIGIRFEPNTVYKAEITLTARDPYAFDPDSPFKYLTVEAGEPEGNNTDRYSRTLTVQYNETEGESVNQDIQTLLGYDLQRYVPVPVTGAAAVTAFNTPDKAITVQWKNSEGGNIDAPQPFVKNTVYKAEITLRAIESNPFDPDIPFRYLTAAAGEPEGDNSRSNHRTLTVLYYPTREEAGKSSSREVVDYDLQHYVPVPVTGAAPITALTRPDLTVTVHWKDADGGNLLTVPNHFEENTKYRAEIIMTAREPYTFNAETSFKYSAAAVEGQPANNTSPQVRSLNIVYNQTGEDPGNSVNQTVLDYDLQRYVPVPTIGALAVTGFKRPDMEITVKWKNASGESINPTSPFLSNTEYRAEITLEAQDPYIFDTTIPFKYLTAAVKTQSEDNLNGKSRTLNVTYNPANEGNLVQDYDLQRYVPVPVVGAAPIKELDLPELEVKVEWQNEDGVEISNLDLFAGGTVYKAKITLTAKDPLIFKAIPFIYRSAEVATQPEENSNEEERVLTVTYKPTGEGPKVWDYDLQHYVPVPVVGAKPIWNLDRQELTVSVKWKDPAWQDYEEDGIVSFVRDMVYLAEITLTAREPYAFDASKPFDYVSTAAEVSNANNDDFTNSHTTKRILNVSYYAARDSSGNGVQEVVNYDLAHYVPVPALGAVVIKDIVRPDLTVHVQWEKDGADITEALESFEMGTQYDAVITLKARNLYTFVTGTPFNYTIMDVKEQRDLDVNDAKERIVTVTYHTTKDAVEISAIDLTSYIPMPATGEQPVKTFPEHNADSGPFKGEVIKWEIGTETKPEGPFKPDTIYTAEVKLTANGNYKFAAKPSVTHSASRKVGEFRPINDFEELTGLITFPATGVTTLTRFSGDAVQDGDSLIDLIREAAGQSSLRLQLTPETETVTLTDTTDLRETGLDLMHDYNNLENSSKTTSPANLVIDGGGMTIDLIGSPTGSPLITVGNGVTLTLRNITLKGLASGSTGDNEDNNAPMILVESGGRLIMEDGVQITENNNIIENTGNTTENSVGGVSVATDGMFTMNGGEIHNNTGNGVNVDGTFTMYIGAAIRNNKSGSGVSVNGSGVFTMYNGTIRKNEPSSAGGGVSVVGLFIMHDGNIEDNKTGENGGGVYLNTGGYMIMHHGIIRNNTATNHGGGVSVAHGDSTFTMHTGTISGNTAGENGGGVYLDGGGSFILNGGTISGNTAKTGHGGGVAVDVGSFSMNNAGGFIRGNNVDNKDGYGGGVYVGEKGTFSMNNGSISGNSIYSGGDAPSGDGKGCGVYVHQNGKFHKTGGTIFGLAPAGEKKWENIIHQNYYRKMIHEQSLGNLVDVSENVHVPYEDNNNAVYSEFVKYRGFAVYYDFYTEHDEDENAIEQDREQDWYRNVTAGSGDVMDTEDGDCWVREYYVTPESSE